MAIVLPNDPLFSQQWYLHNPGGTTTLLPAPAGIDINWLPIWQEYDGTGVTMSVIDDLPSIPSHPDLAPAVIGSFVDHALAVYYLIKGLTNNASGGAGIAPNAVVTPYQGIGTGASTGGVVAMVNHDVSNLSIQFDIFTNAQTFTTINSINTGISVQTYLNSYINTTDNGRPTGGLGGIALGGIICMAAGNQRERPATATANLPGHETTLDYRVSSDRIITVGAVGIDGYVTSYSSPGASILVTAPSSTFTAADQLVGGILAADRPGATGNDPTEWVETFGGTSAATPMVSSIASLMLEANPNLGWRDVQDILAYSARQVGSLKFADASPSAANEKYEWIFNAAKDWNGGGLHYSNDYGFGLVDAHAAVRMAETWTAQSISANQTRIDKLLATPFVPVPDNNPAGVTRQFTFGANENVRIDAVALTVDFASGHTNMSELTITLISPSGTEHVLITNAGAFLDIGFHTFVDRAFRNETSVGTWTVRIADTVAGSNVASLEDLTLSVRGDLVTPANTYVYTNEFSDWAATDASRRTLIDTGGFDTINAAAVTTGSFINLGSNVFSRIDGVFFSTGATTVIENAYGGDGNDIIQGNAGANRLWGGRGADTLKGLGGADTMIGGQANDTYFVDHVSDVTSETIASVAIGGNDLVVSSVTRTLGANLERLTLTGTSAINGTGNAANNVIFGNGEANTLRGEAGADILNGLGGADIMIGGDGNDTYYVDNTLDVTSETNATLATGGNDLVISTVTRTLGANLERLTLTGTAAINGTGNALNNTITGNAGANILNGGLGVDTLAGGAGPDTFVFNTLVSAANRDVINGFSSLDDIIHLDNAVFATLGAAGAIGGRFWSSATGLAHDADDRIIYNTANGVLTYDSNGNVAGGSVIQFAILLGKPAINATDFLVV